MTREQWSLYVHVPWCRLRCPYCSFFVDTAKDRPERSFIAAIQRELQQRRAAMPSCPPESVYIGGGTPSRMTALPELLDVLPRSLDVTIEANPEDVHTEWLKPLLQKGVTRLSIGVQTFQSQHARRLGRAFTLDDLQRALTLATKSGLHSWSADLMFGFPSQTIDELQHDLDELIRWSPPHISLYGLTWEPGTAFERAKQAGSLVPIHNEVEAEMLERIVERLQREGYERYEVSNFARPGHRSHHNVGYWTDRPYLGLGPSAHGYLPDDTRYQNIADLPRYLADQDPTLHSEQTTGQTLAVDLLISGLRGIDGLSLDYLARRTGWSLQTHIIDLLSSHRLLKLQSDRLSLTPEGMQKCNGVLQHLVDALYFV